MVCALLLLVGAGCGGNKKKNAPPTTQDLYQTALLYIEDEKYIRARDVLSRIGVRDLQESEFDPLIKIALADAYFLDGGITNIIEAQARYEQFIAFYPSHERAAYAQFRVGECLFKQSAKPHHDQEYTRKAMAEFERVRTVNPDSEYVARADEMIQACREKLAQHQFDVGHFYFRREACEAAAGRFRIVLNDFPRFSKTDETYYYLGRSLLCSNNSEEGRIYLDKLINDYPESEFAAKAREIVASDEG
jgi:outer membrane protein assembly factor BamD